MAFWAILRLGASVVVALALALSAHAADYDYGDSGNGYGDNAHGHNGHRHNGHRDNGFPDNGDRRSTWELNTSLTFRHYFEPFPRVDSARACRDQCVYDRRCTGWTYYDSNFRHAGAQSYRLQRVCVLGAGVRDRQSGNRPGRTSGVVRPLGRHGGPED